MFCNSCMEAVRGLSEAAPYPRWGKSTQDAVGRRGMQIQGAVVVPRFPPAEAAVVVLGVAVEPHGYNKRGARNFPYRGERRMRANSFHSERHFATLRSFTAVADSPPKKSRIQTALRLCGMSRPIPENAALSVGIPNTRPVSVPPLLRGIQFLPVCGRIIGRRAHGLHYRPINIASSGNLVASA